MSRAAPLAVLALVSLVVVWVVWSAPWRPAYPRTDRGWEARWQAAAAEVGRTPGEGWSVWTDACEALAGVTDADDFAGALLAIVPEEGWPAQITPPAHAVAPEADWAGALDRVADAIAQAADRADADTVFALAGLAERIERGMGMDRGLDAALERFDAGSRVDRALQRAVSLGVFSPGDPRLARLTALNDDAAGFEIAWGVRVQRERAARAAVELGRPETARAIENLCDALDRFASGLPGSAAGVERAGARLREGRHRAAAVLVPDIDDLISRRRAARAERLGLAVMLALERHRARVGHYPDRLEDLVPVESHRLPRDPFGLGEPFGYRPVDPGAARAAEAYRLWSAGPDRADDGGLPLGPDGAGDRVFNPVSDPRVTPPEPAP